MKGKHTIVISNNRVKYEITVKRNITIIRGDSATGKTTLLELLDNFVRFGQESGISMDCDVPVDVYMADDRRTDWKNRLKDAEGSIIFIEEMNAFIKTREFAEYTAHSDSYFVLISRWNLKNLSYSVEEIYKLTEKGKYPKTRQVYNALEKYYTFHIDMNTETDVNRIITEDSGSGFDFFSLYCQEKERKCESADGDSNIIKIIRKNSDKMLCIADGAAFGGFVDECVQYLNYSKKECIMWLPESFEYLLLESGIVKIPDLEDILKNTWKYVDSREFLTWERFYTTLLIEFSKNTKFAYSKSELNDYYKSENSKKRIEKRMPKEILQILKEK